MTKNEQLSIFKHRLIYAVDDSSLTVEQITDRLLDFRFFLHSAKFHILYHKFGPQVIHNISLATGVPIFLDLKLFDTPDTLRETIKCFHDSTKYITIAISEVNVNSISEANYVCRKHNIFPYFVFRLTTDIDNTTNDFNYLCSVAKLYGAGIVCGKSKLCMAKENNLITITPGVKIDKFIKHQYNNQIDTSTDLLELIRLNTIPVLGRAMPDSVDRFKNYLYTLF